MDYWNDLFGHCVPISNLSQTHQRLLRKGREEKESILPHSIALPHKTVKYMGAQLYIESLQMPALLSKFLFLMLALIVMMQAIPGFEHTHR